MNLVNRDHGSVQPQQVAIGRSLTVAVSGSTGFIGSAFVQHLTATGHDICPIKNEAVPRGCDVVVHLAGLAHRKASRREFMEANHADTMRLAERARKYGVGRFVFVSTVNVVAGHHGILSPDLSYEPLSPYGESKAKAERDLLGMDGLEVVVLRPPLVFGPKVKGNLLALMKLCASGLPLPFRAIQNRRSMIGISNLCGALLFLSTAEASEIAGRTFHVAEGGTFSLAQIVTTCRQAMGKSPRLVAVPPYTLRFVAGLLWQQKLADQLLGDLVVDDASLIAAGWRRNDSALSDMVEMARAL